MNFTIGKINVHVNGSALSFFKAELYNFAKGKDKAQFDIYIEETNHLDEPFYEKISMREGKKYIHVPFGDLDKHTIRLTYEQGLPPAFVFYIFEPVLHLFLLKTGYALVHGASFTLGGKGVWLTSWGGTGKTNFILHGLTSVSDFGYMSDDWTIISSDGRILAYPKRIRIYGYNLIEYPELPISSKNIKIIRYKIQKRLRNLLPSRWLRILLTKFEPKYILYPTDIRKDAEITRETKAKLSLLMMKEDVQEPLISDIELDRFIDAVTACVRFERDYFFKEYYKYAHYAYSVNIIENHDKILKNILRSYLKKSDNVSLIKVPFEMNRKRTTELYNLIRKIVEE